MSEQFIAVRHDLTEEELAGIAADMTQRVLKVADLEDEKKEITKRFGEEIKEEESEMLRLAELYDAGYEEQSILCGLNVDYDAGERQWISVETGEIVRTDPLLPEDRQLTLDTTKTDTPTVAPIVEVGEQGLPLTEKDEPPLITFLDAHERVLNMVRNHEGATALSFRTNTKKIRQAAQELIGLEYLTGEDFNSVTGLTKSGEELFTSGRVMSIPF